MTTTTERTTLTVADDGRVVAIVVAKYEPCRHHGHEWLWGYKDIGKAVNRNERWARRHAHLMPILWVSGKPTLTLADLTAWLNGQRVP